MMIRKALCILAVLVLAIPAALAEDAGVRLAPGMYRSMKFLMNYLNSGDTDKKVSGIAPLEAPVTKMQKRLIELGYLSGSPSGVYDQKTVEAVAAFKSKNGISGNGNSLYLDESFVLYSDAAIPANALELVAGQWKANGSKLNMRVQIKNNYKNKTVKGFELYMYATDIWGERIYGATTVYYATTKQTIKPGNKAYSDYMTLPDRSKIDRVHVGIHRVAFDDDTTMEFNNPEYYYWDIK